MFDNQAQVIDQQEKATLEVIRYRASLSQQVWDATPEGPEWSSDRFNFILADYLQKSAIHRNCCPTCQDSRDRGREPVLLMKSSNDHLCFPSEARPYSIELQSKPPKKHGRPRSARDLASWVHICR